MSVRACKGSPLRILGPSRWQLGFAEPGLSRAAVGVPPLRKSKIDGPALTGLAGRLHRALRNFIETFPLFAAAVLTAHVAGTHSWMTEWGAQLYFGARLIYVALYAAGVFLARSLVWNAATLGIVLILFALIWA